MRNVDITIAICSHNRAEGLRDCLRSLVALETEGLFTYEILVIHTASPGTAQVIEEAGRGTGITVRGIHHAQKGAVTARNRGIREAAGEWIALFDDDQLAAPQWLKELWLLAREKKARSVGGALLLQLPAGCSRELTSRCRRMLGETVEWTEVQPYTRQEGPGSGNQMIHRTVFEEVGEYDESFTLRGYDTDMYRRIRMAGIESWFTPKALGYHVIPASRLKVDFFKETSLHNGWSFARRDRLERGIGWSSLIALARLLQATLIHVPRLALRMLSGKPDQILDGRIPLWRTEGYIRSTLYMLAPRWFQQPRFFSQYEFRAEKSMLSVPS